LVNEKELLAALLLLQESLLDNALGDTSLLSGEVAQVVQLSAANLTVLVDGDVLDVGTIEREDTLYADVAGHLANGEALATLAAGDANDITAEVLNTLLRPFLDTIGNSYRVSSLKCRKLFFLTGKSLFCNFNQIHFTKALVASLEAVSSSTRHFKRCPFAHMEKDAQREAYAKSGAKVLLFFDMCKYFG